MVRVKSGLPAKTAAIRTRHILLTIPLALLLVAGALAARGKEANGFVVKIVLSRKAASTLARRREGMVIMVSYYGWPKSSAQRYGDEVGRIDFGSNHVLTIPGRAGQYPVPGTKFDRKRLDWLNGPAMVNVNIVSARKSGPDNLLDCESIDRPLAEIHTTLNILHCRLIRGDS